jgi:hypothetical protein
MKFSYIFIFIFKSYSRSTNAIVFSMIINCVVIIYSHMITYSHIYNHVVLIMVGIKKMTTTKVQI